MHAADDGVGRDDEIVTRRRREHRSVVDQPQRARMASNRLEMAGDQPVFVGLRLSAFSPRHYLDARSNSAARNCRAI